MEKNVLCVCKAGFMNEIKHTHTHTHTHTEMQGFSGWWGENNGSHASPLKRKTKERSPGPLYLPVSVVCTHAVCVRVCVCVYVCVCVRKGMGAGGITEAPQRDMRGSAGLAWGTTVNNVCLHHSDKSRTAGRLKKRNTLGRYLSPRVPLSYGKHNWRRWENGETSV
ncbi:hypothetical protein PGIGA_G00208890 [Pangasianodon gigas]|uniref:Uncharacterized protein n=1 Tax=Pangasianodon gigas TaxID=30993 RepID=A0ACC5WGE0_PANGG|nr:hypothetical protein [Pangasianodon gigas]